MSDRPESAASDTAAGDSAAGDTAITQTGESHQRQDSKIPFLAHDLFSTNRDAYERDRKTIQDPGLTDRMVRYFTKAGMNEANAKAITERVMSRLQDDVEQSCWTQHTEGPTGAPSTTQGRYAPRHSAEEELEAWTSIYGDILDTPGGWPALRSFSDEDGLPHIFARLSDAGVLYNARLTPDPSEGEPPMTQYSGRPPPPAESEAPPADPLDQAANPRTRRQVQGEAHMSQ